MVIKVRVEEHKVPPRYSRAGEIARSLYGCRDDVPGVRSSWNWSDPSSSAQFRIWLAHGNAL